MPSIRINNNNITPWNMIDNRIRSRRINRLRSSVRKNTTMRYNLYNFANVVPQESYDNQQIKNIARDISLNENCLPPTRTKIDKIWRNYIIPRRTLNVFLINADNNNIVFALSDTIKFHEFYINQRTLNASDIYFYKYCVIIAGLNILRKIISCIPNVEAVESSELSFPIINPISYICYSDIQKPSKIIKVGDEYKLRISIDKFICLLSNIPIYEQNSDMEIYTRLSYNNFWNNLLKFYLNTSNINMNLNFKNKQSFPLLEEEYINRIDNENNFISKKQIISMIEKKQTTNNTLDSIYNIISSFENKNNAYTN